MNAVRTTKIKGIFGTPIGVQVMDYGVGNRAKFVTVSTVELYGAHALDPLGITEAETGYETKVFMEGCTFFSLHTRHYRTRRGAIRGHRRVVQRLMDQSLPLGIEMSHYAAHEVCK